MKYFIAAILNIAGYYILIFANILETFLQVKKVKISYAILLFFFPHSVAENQKLKISGEISCAIS